MSGQKNVNKECDDMRTAIDRFRDWLGKTIADHRCELTTSLEIVSQHAKTDLAEEHPETHARDWAGLMRALDTERYGIELLKAVQVALHNSIKSVAKNGTICRHE